MRTDCRTASAVPRGVENLSALGHLLPVIFESLVSNLSFASSGHTKREPFNNINTGEGSGHAKSFNNPNSVCWLQEAHYSLQNC